MCPLAGTPIVNRRDRFLTRGAAVAFAAALLALFLFSLHLARTRIYQVDECDTLFVARVLATGQSDAFQTGLTLFHVPFMALARHATESVRLFTDGRMVALAVFWVNLALLAIATGERLFSVRGLAAFVAAATLAPLWDYGFEIRHDNVLLTGLLLTWCVIRIRHADAWALFCAGALAVILEFVAFKAFVYTVPMFFCAVVMVRRGVPVWRRAAAWAAGAVVALAVLRGVFEAAGLWSIFVRHVAGMAATAGHTDRFFPWQTLARIFRQSPLLVGLTIAGLVDLLIGTPARAAERRERLWPEALLVLCTFAALLMNPTPFPYNLVNFVPFLFAFAYRSLLLQLESSRPPARQAVVLTLAALSAAHLAPFAIATARHLRMTNTRQQQVMRAAEALTDPVTDTVYDGIGMVPTRRSIAPRWLLHSLNIASFTNRTDRSVRDMLRANPATVLIQSYRTDWLPREDHEFIRQHYLPLSDDLSVLASVVPAGSASVEIGHAGRYRVLGAAPAATGIAANPFAPSAPSVTVDGAPLTSGVVWLDAGRHSVATTSAAGLVFAWIGPTLTRFPQLEGSDHRFLFVNWY